jgi:hypothetical protein
VPRACATPSRRWRKSPALPPEISTQHRTRHPAVHNADALCQHSNVVPRFERDLSQPRTRPRYKILTGGGSHLISSLLHVSGNLLHLRTSLVEVPRPAAVMLSPIHPSLLLFQPPIPWRVRQPCASYLHQSSLRTVPWTCFYEDSSFVSLRSLYTVWQATPARQTMTDPVLEHSLGLVRVSKPSSETP